MERNTIVVHKEWTEALMKVSGDIRLEVYDAIFAYAFDGIIPDMTEVARMAFNLFQVQIDRDQAKYEAKCNKLRENAHKPRKRKKSSDDEQLIANANKSKQLIANANKSKQIGYDNNKSSKEDYDISNNTTLLNTDVISRESTDVAVDPQIDWQGFVNFWNNCTSKCNIPGLKSFSEERKKAVKARIHEYSKETLMQVIKMACSSNFLNGANQRNFIATFDWIMKRSNFTKILEGNYGNTSNNNGTTINSNRSTRESRELEAASIVERLLREDN